jgi:hypothetical protein
MTTSNKNGRSERSKLTGKGATKSVAAEPPQGCVSGGLNIRVVMVKNTNKGQHELLTTGLGLASKELKAEIWIRERDHDGKLKDWELAHTAHGTNGRLLRQRLSGLLYQVVERSTECMV